MYCPSCGGEYREGFFQCADCDVALVETPPPISGDLPVPDLELVTVLETGDPALLAIAESLLQEADIPYLKKGESLQDLFALGRMAFGFNPITGPVLLQVPEEHAETASLLLQKVETGELEDPDPLSEGP